MTQQPVQGAGVRLHRAPSACPVCSHELITLRIGCPSCATELSGHFSPCRFCHLDGSELALLEVFLRSRGNVKDVQAALGVSYPTARQRVAELLARLGYGDAATEPTAGVAAVPPPAGAGTRAPLDVPGATSPGAAGDGPALTGRSAAEAVLAELAAGRIDVSAAEVLLRGLYPGH